jgi:peptidoglycan/LPS O-acetylase OafA/YrhL
MATKETIEPLTGLRGIAALLVVHSHYFFWCAPYTTESIPRHLLNASNTANFGMSLFFTLSGFVITYHYWNFGWRESPAAAFFRFLFLRLSRLYPVFLLFFALQFKSTSIDGDFFGDRWLSAALIHVFNLESWYPIQFKDALVDGSGYFVSWSISTEIGMYLIFATALVLVGRFTRHVGPVLAATAAIYVGLTLAAVHFNDSVAATLARLPILYDALEPNYAWRWFYYLSPYFRLTQFIFGAFAAMLVLKEWDVGLRFHLSNLSTISAALILVLYIDVIVSGKISPEASQLMQSSLFAIIIENDRTKQILKRAISKKDKTFLDLIY